MARGDDRYLRELRRNELARRMLIAGARNCIVTEWTAMSDARVIRLKANLGHEPGPAQPRARRGPPPKILATFFKTPALRNEASALAVLFEVFGIMPPGRHPMSPSAFRSIGRGERLCDVWDLYPDVVEQPRLTFEHIVLLAVSLGTTADLAVEPCGCCGAVLVLEHWQRRPLLCATCAARSPGAEHEATHELDLIGAHSEREPIGALQRSLF